MPPPTDPLCDTPVLADGVHMARLSDGLVFLDIPRDRYFCLYHPIAPSADAAPPPSIHAELVALGLAAARPAGPTAAAACPVTPRWRELPDALQPRIGARDVAYYLLALVRAAWFFRGAPLDRLLEHAGPTPRQAPRMSLAQASARFDRLSRWLPVRIECLFRAFFQLHFLGCYGLAAEWIFGVSLFPFHAHCWLADGDLLLGERIGKVEGFTVIYRRERARR